MQDALIPAMIKIFPLYGAHQDGSQPPFRVGAVVSVWGHQARNRATGLSQLKHSAGPSAYAEDVGSSDLNPVHLLIRYPP